MSIDRRQVIIDSVVLSAVVLAGIIGVVIVADPPDIERSHDGRPAYIVAPGDTITGPEYMTPDPDQWVVFKLCPRTAIPWGVAAAKNRSAAINVMEALPPPRERCPRLLPEE